MKLTVTIDISAKKYKKAIVRGWKEQYGEEITEADVGTLENVDDFQWAVRHLGLNDENTAIEAG